jgi:predicted DNA binding CopG/RHH family protein
MPKIPKFKTLKEEGEFWDAHSVADYWHELEDVEGQLIDARPAKKLVSIRFDPALIVAAKRIARTKGLGYQTLLRMWAYEGLGRELGRRAPEKPKKRRTA